MTGKSENTVQNSVKYVILRDGDEYLTWNIFPKMKLKLSMIIGSLLLKDGQMDRKLKL